VAAPRAHLVRAALAAAVVLAGIGVLGRGLSGGGPQAAVLDLPPPGQVSPAELPDGTPVFVVHTRAGDAHVIEAVNPHPFWGMTTLVGWCRPAGAFEQPLDGSRFDAAGRWLFGPAPRDLATYDIARNAEVVQVGERRVPDGRSPAGDPAVRQWCDRSVTTLDLAGEPLAPQPLAGELVAHPADGTAELLGVPGQQLRWCDGIQATDPPRCAATVAVLPTAAMEGDLPWSWEGPVRGTRADPAGVQLLPGGREEYPARGTLTRVFGRVRRLSTVADTLRITVNRKVVFGDFFTAARPLELGEPVPRLWKIEDQDGPVLSTFTLPEGTEEEQARRYVGELVDMVVAVNSRVVSIDFLPRARR
jgi:hypothetical protein